MFFPTPKQLQTHDVPRYSYDRLLAEWSMDIAEAMGRGETQISLDLGSPVFFGYKHINGIETIITTLENRLKESGWSWNVSHYVNPLVGDSITLRWFPLETSSDELL